VSPTTWGVFIALVWAAGGGLLAWIATYPLHRRSLGWLLASVAITGSISTVASVLGSVRAMSLPGNYQAQTILVALVAGLVSIAFAVGAGRRLAGDNRTLLHALSELGEGRIPIQRGRRLSAELEGVRLELTETARKLAGSREREHALESSRRELVAWVSHDLRAPLASLRAMSEALEDGVADSPEIYYKQIHSSVDRLSRMVDDLFELSRIQAGNIGIKTEHVALDDLVSDCIAALDPLANAHRVRLTGRTAGAATVVGNGRELNRALTNLVANAIRHTRADGLVDVTVTAEAGSAEVTVRDECGGIPETELGRVFDVGFRGESARTPTPASNAGAGLGLAITRGIVEAHGGDVNVHNVDGGCSFVVRLPAAA
jgi:signal transduction histidine kinase